MKIFVYSGTHWDREWYQTFQGFRKRLVDTVDELIDSLETLDDYGVFHFDGQTIVLEDYLEIRPENADRLAALIRKGKIVIGPWYDMPDEFIVSGESLIKNLRRGHEICAEYGVKPCENAYICDIFGHSSQTPQIFRSFGHGHTVLGRGLSDLDAEGNFVWQALDGSYVTAYHLPDIGGYGDFGGFIETHPLTLPKEEIISAMRGYFGEELKRAGVPVIVAFDAVDHRPIRKDTGKYVELLREAFPDDEIYHVSIDEYGKAIDAFVSALKTLKGELARPGRLPGGYVHVITNTVSSRYPIKKYNDQNQTRLEKWAAPCYALWGTDMSYGFYDLAVKYLLRNHPHDSICGCSIDQVHRDMTYRFDQTRELCDEIIRPIMRSFEGDISKYALTSPGNGGGKRLRVFNPLPYAVKQTVEAVVDLNGLPTYAEPFGYENVPSFFMYDADGSRIDYGFVRNHGSGIYDISFEAELTPCGMTEFSLVPSEKPSRNPYLMQTTTASVRAEKIELSVNPDGTVNLTDLETGNRYENLLTLVDNGEIGDGWYHCSPGIDRIVSQNRAEVEITENSPVRVTFRIVQHLELPARIERIPAIHRSEETVDYKVISTVSVSKHGRGIDVTTEIDNNVKDHRLRLRLPKIVEGDTYEASQSFGYVTRRCGDDKSTADWKEYDWGLRNFKGIAAKRSGNRGLAFISAYGLLECAVSPEGNMDITLMRCYSKTVMTSGEPDGELQQKLSYRYRIVPFTEGEDFSDLQKQQDSIAAGLNFTTVGGSAQKYDSALTVEGRNVVYSTAELLPDRKTPSVRVYNDGDEETEAVITLPAGVKEASLIELDGREIAPLAVDGRKVSFTLPPFRIATVKFTK